MILLVINSFLSAFLLFQIQPMIGKSLLPVFGGGASIWSATMLSFQLLLLAGYLYAYVLSKKVPARFQTLVHNCFLFASCLVLAILAFFQSSPIAPPVNFVSTLSELPVVAIVLMIGLSVGLPYFVLASNSTLMQVWLARKGVRDPYWMYSYSNAGSSLALLSYPFVIEPFVGVTRQGWLWSSLFAVFAVITFYINRTMSSGNVNTELTSTTVKSTKLSFTTISLWVALSAVPSLLLLAVTSQITQEVAPIPLLWVAPLFLYLLTFIIAFGSERFYNPRLAAYLLFIATAGVFFSNLGFHLNITVQILIFLISFFIYAWACHGELYRLRPDSDSIQLFYVFVAVGGALGGLFVSVVAPLIFDRYLEFHLGVTLVWLLFGILSVRATPKDWSFLKRIVVSNFQMSMVIVFAVLFIGFKLNYIDRIGYHERNFYAVVRIARSGQPSDDDHSFRMYHGMTMHGLQFTKPDYQFEPTAYFTRTSGVGRTLTYLTENERPLKVAITGLGVGSLAVYGREGDEYTFYEINPAVSELAAGKHNFFSYLEQSRAKISVINGDGRLMLEKHTPENSLDLMIADAFSSDSIPVHLLTLEALQQALTKLKKPNGLLAINISNIHLDLLPICQNLATALGLKIMVVNDDLQNDMFGRSSTWVITAFNGEVLQEIMNRNPNGARLLDTSGPVNSRYLWTDDFSNLFWDFKTK